MATTLLSEGKTPVLFGQDQVSCRLIAEQRDVVLASGLMASSDDGLALALAEIVLMSRCEEIYAGSSGFARLAAAISGQEMRARTAGLSKARMIAAIKDDPDMADDSPLPALQKAFGQYMMQHIGWPALISPGRA